MAENVLNFITVMPETEHIHVFYNFNLIREDPDDNKFVDCATAANAHYLVSNDGHYEALLSVAFPKINWIRLTDFDKQYKDQLAVKPS